MSLWGCEELYVTGLPGDVTEPELRGLFGSHGTVKEAVIVNKKGPSAPGAPQSCIVRMGTHIDAVKAKKALNKYDWMGKQIGVKWSHNQRVLWIGNLHDGVTNEVLHAAFTQFGAVSKAVVACDAPNNTSKGWGFVSFENKRFAVKALEGVHERPFLVGTGFKPVMADWARNEEIMEGFSEEVRSGNKGAPAPVAPENAGHFPPPNSKEGMQGGRMLALRNEYNELRAMLKMRLAEAENQIVITGNSPRLSQMLMSDPHLAPPPPSYMHAPPPPGHMGGPPMGGPPRPPMGPPPPGGPPGQYMGGPPMGPGPGPYNYPPPGAPGGGMKREGESFHHVPPPNKRVMNAHATDRFNPNPNAALGVKPEPGAAPPPQQQHQQPEPQQPQQPAQRPSSAFVRGGELHTVAGQQHQQHQQHQQQQAGQPAQAPGAGGAEAHVAHSGHGDGGTAPPAVGAKPPGSHDHGGIGFAGPPATATSPAGATGTAGVQSAPKSIAAGAAAAPYSYDTTSTAGRAPYTAYATYPQQAPAAPVPAGPATYGLQAAPAPPPPQQQQAYGMYGAPVQGGQAQAAQQQQGQGAAYPGQQPQQQAAAVTVPAGYTAPPEQQQQYYQYYQQQQAYYQPGGQPQQQQPGQMTAAYASGGAGGAPAMQGPPQQQQQAYGMPQQQQMYGMPQQGQGYYQ